MDKTYKRHQRIYSFLYPFARLAIYLKFRYTFEPVPDIEGSYIVLCNHNTDWDPILVGTSFRKQMYFVASEHVFRLNKLLRWFLVRYFSPIPILKSSADVSAVLSIRRMLRKGMRVCIFAEGNRSFNGRTCSISPSAAKLVKSSGSTLVTYRLIGGYLSSPRWSLFTRKGRMRGECVNVYTPEKIKSMSLEELHNSIVSDLNEDAFIRESVEKIPYRGKKPAEALEYALAVCPSCRQIGTIKSRNDLVLCSCGLKLRYNSYGMFESVSSEDPPPFENVALWDDWQNQQFERILSEIPEESPVFSDENQQLYLLGDNLEMKLLTTGRMALYKSHLDIGEYSFPVSDIARISIHGKDQLGFSIEDTHYRIESSDIRNGRKYVTVFNMLKS